jgi:hypothetical protein
MNPDVWASAIDVLKKNLPDIKGAQVILHSSGHGIEECRNLDRTKSKRIACCLQELERILPLGARLDSIGIEHHQDFRKQWQSVRQSWQDHLRLKTPSVVSVEAVGWVGEDYFFK